MENTHRRWFSIPVGCLLCSALGCGPGSVAEAVRPEAPTAESALGDEQDEVACRDVSRGAEPLVVDWKPEQRGDLELAMKEGVAVVKYSCEGMQLLERCKLPGDYGYLGMTRREQVVKLESADEVHANLPLGGANLGAGLERGVSLDVAVVLVGKRRTTMAEPTRAELEGQCEGATHYVQGAMVGAFAVGTGSSAKTQAVAEVFGASAGGSSESSKQVKTKEGDLGDCQKAAPDSESPPAQCGAAVRLVLVPIREASAEGEAAPAAAASKPAALCPEGLVFSEGKCTKPDTAPAYQCAPDNRAECETQCTKGHAGSCGSLGVLTVDAEPAAAAEPLKKGCEGGAIAACTQLGRLEEQGKGVGEDKAAAVKHYTLACDGGDAEGCRHLARANQEGVGGLAKNPERATELYERGCEGGDAPSCAAAAAGLAEKPDTAEQVANLHRRACHGGVTASCVQVAIQFETGNGAPKNPVLAEMYYRRACMFGERSACVDLGRLLYARSPDEAKRQFEMACRFNDALACAALAATFEPDRKIVPDLRLLEPLRKQCMASNPRACALQAILELAQKSPAAKGTLSRACTLGDRMSCELQKKQ